MTKVKIRTDKQLKEFINKGGRVLAECGVLEEIKKGGILIDMKR